MARGSLIDSYLTELEAEARRAGVDPRRVVAEARDHLAQAAAAHVRRGTAREDAERRAIEGFGGAEAIVLELVASRKGAAMNSRMERAAVALGLAATAALFAIHAATSTDLASQPALVKATRALLATTGAAGVVLAWEGRRRWRGTWIVAAATSAIIGTAAWAAATSALTGAVGSARVADWTEEAMLGAVVLSLAARWAPLGRRIPIGLIAAGSLGLLALETFYPLGDLGGGVANTPILLMLLGWVWLAWVAWAPAARVPALRAAVGRALMGLATLIGTGPQDSTRVRTPVSGS